MELVNSTPYPAHIFRTVIDQERIAASVFTRVTFDVVGGSLRVSREQRWPVSGPPWDSPYGPMDSDEVFWRGGVDVFLFGHARAPGLKPVPRMEVRLGIGSWHYSLLVIGDRRWERRQDALIPTEPEPFTEMPLTLEHAFGGKAEWDGLAVAYPANDRGKGFFIDEEQAEGGALPNLEDPDTPITGWTDQPEPVGVGPCPISCSLRTRNAVVLDKDGQLLEIRPHLFNAAFPRMIAERVEPGDTVWVDGVQPNGRFTFRLPDVAPRVRLQFGDEVIDRRLAIDQIGIEADEGRVFVAYRYPFRYVVYPLQRRHCELFRHDVSLVGGASR
jgi:hypothetical protein